MKKNVVDLKVGDFIWRNGRAAEVMENNGHDGHGGFEIILKEFSVRDEKYNFSPDSNFDVCHPKPRYMIGDWVKSKLSNMKFQVHDIFVRDIDPFKYRYLNGSISSHVYEEDLVLIRPRDETLMEYFEKILTRLDNIEEKLNMSNKNGNVTHCK